MTSKAKRTADNLLAMAQMIKNKAIADDNCAVAEIPLPELALMVQDIIREERKAGRIPTFNGLKLN